MRQRIEQHRLSFGYALNGIKLAIQYGHNLQLQLAVGIFVFVISLLLHISWLESIALFLTISIVIICEMINTAIESVVNLLTSEWREEAKIAKDVAAGMVLVSAIFSIIIGCMIFLPYLFLYRFVF